MKNNKHFERSWQKAFDSAVLRPSPDVWAGVEKALDTNASSRGWLPILLVAASVSLAMALPFTIGESKLPFEQIYNDQGAQISKNNEAQKQLLDQNTSQTLGSEHTNGFANYDDGLNGAVSSESSQHNNLTLAEEVIENKISELMDANAKGTQISKIGFYELMVGDIPYYLVGGMLPFEIKETRSQLLAVNIGGGSGNSSSQGGSDMFSSALETSDATTSNGFRNYTALPGSEENRRGIVVGFGFELPLSKRSALQFGLNYFNSRANGMSSRVVHSNNLITPLAHKDVVKEGMAYTDDLFSYSVTDNYINIPVVFKYPFLDRKLVIRGGIGTGIDILVNHVVNSDLYGNASYSGKSVALSPLWVNGVGNIDIGYWIVPRYLLSLEAGLSSWLWFWSQQGCECQ